jgi:hypothetical protein
MKKIAMLIITCCLLAGCKKERNQLMPENSFVFGSYHSLCYDDYAFLYKIEGQQLFPDNTNYFTSPLIFFATPLANGKYLIAKPVQDSFPVYLTSHADSTYGCPDCYDQGMIYIEKTVNGVKRKWIIDAEVSAIPAEIRTYIQQVKNVIQQL